MAVRVGAQIGFQMGPEGGGLAVPDALRIVIFVAVSLIIAIITSRLEAALDDQRRRQAEIRSVVDNVVEALVLISHEGRVRRVNRRFEELFSVGASDVVGRSVDELHPVAERAFQGPAAVEEALRSTTDSRPDRLTNTFVQVWPRERQLELFSTPVTSDGRSLGGLYGFRDVTHERELDRMKPSSCLRSRTSCGPRSPRSRVSPINDLLDISRIESRRIRLKIEVVDLRAVIHEVAVSMEPLVAGNHQTLSVDVPGDLPPARADHDRVVQILTNLVSNAHKYTQEEGASRSSPSGWTVRWW